MLMTLNRYYNTYDVDFEEYHYFSVKFDTNRVILFNSFVLSAKLYAMVASEVSTYHFVSSCEVFAATMVLCYV